MTSARYTTIEVSHVGVGSYSPTTEVTCIVKYIATVNGSVQYVAPSNRYCASGVLNSVAIGVESAAGEAMIAVGVAEDVGTSL